MLKTLLEQGYSAYQQLKQADTVKAPQTNGPAASAPVEAPRPPLDERTVTPRIKVPVSDLRFNLSQERAELQQLLRNKLADTGLPPGTQILLKRTPIGTMAVEGKLTPPQREQLEHNLNQSSEVRRLFNRLSEHQPAVEFVSNADKLAKTYGVSNQALDAIVSRESEHNSLQDLTLRLEELRRQNPASVSGESPTSFGLAVSV